jgi:hypothetical protein
MAVVSKASNAVGLNSCCRGRTVGRIQRLGSLCRGPSMLACLAPLPRCAPLELTLASGLERVALVGLIDQFGCDVASCLGREFSVDRAGQLQHSHGHQQVILAVRCSNASIVPALRGVNNGRRLIPISGAYIGMSLRHRMSCWTSRLQRATSVVAHASRSVEPVKIVTPR